MDNIKPAVLFYNKGLTPIPFSEYKCYEIGTGYVALYEPEDSYCVLCRILDNREILLFAGNAHKLILKDKKSTQSVIIINSILVNIEEADLLISNYSKVI